MVSPGPAKAKAAVKVNFGKAAVRPLFALLPTEDVKVSPVVDASLTYIVFVPVNIGVV